MTIVGRTAVVCALLICAPALAPAQKVRTPAEWEPQERVWLTWFGQGRRDSVSADILRALQPHVRLTLTVQSESMKANARTFLGAQGLDVDGLDYAIDPNVDYFARDYVVFVKDDADKVRVVDFLHTAYGQFLPNTTPAISPFEARFGQWEERLARQLDLPLITSDLAFEAGGIDTNGKGTFLVIKQMALQRNPTRTIAQIEAELKRTLGAEKIIWLEHGLIEDRRLPRSAPFYRNYFGGGANMHVDELARFVNDTTVILPFIPTAEKNRSPVDSINFPILEENARILRSASTADGRRLTIVRIPMPEIEQLKFTLPVDDTNLRTYSQHGFQKGDSVYRVPAASYVNYFVSNNVVLIPKYWKAGMPESQRQKDEDVRQQFVKLFPGRQVVSIYTLGINRGGGGIHCATRELPGPAR